jgi:MarR family transcriptional regulator, organic hydroperoxide resistance regulator
MPVDQPQFEDLVCFNFYQGWRHVQAIYRQAFPAGVTPQRAYLLCACDPADATSVAALIEALELDAAGMSGLLGRLEADGLIERAVNPADRREVLVSLTPAGALLREECLSALLRADESLHQAISARDVIGLKNVVIRLGGLT